RLQRSLHRRAAGQAAAGADRAGRRDGDQGRDPRFFRRGEAGKAVAELADILVLDLELISPSEALRMSVDELSYWAQRIAPRLKKRRIEAQPVFIVRRW